MKTITEVSLPDQADEKFSTLDVLIEISDQGITITPKPPLNYAGPEGIFPREVFIEFYLEGLRVHIWDGTSEDPAMQHTVME